MTERVAKQVIVMRKDLNMRKGKMIAQGAHASLGAVLIIMGERVGWEYRDLQTDPWPDYHAAYDQWINGTFTKVCVSVNSEEELLAVQVAAEKAELPVKLITDAGYTEFHGVPTLTCLAIGPAWADEIDKITGHLPLL